MLTEEVQQILDDNTILLNIGGHCFEGSTKHNRKKQGLLQLSDLKPFEDRGIVKRLYGFDGFGKKYIAGFRGDNR